MRVHERSDRVFVRQFVLFSVQNVRKDVPFNRVFPYVYQVFPYQRLAELRGNPALFLQFPFRHVLRRHQPTDELLHVHNGGNEKRLFYPLIDPRSHGIIRPDTVGNQNDLFVPFPQPVDRCTDLPTGKELRLPTILQPDYVAVRKKRLVPFRLFCVSSFSVHVQNNVHRFLVFFLL